MADGFCLFLPVPYWDAGNCSGDHNLSFTTINFDKDSVFFEPEDLMVRNLSQNPLGNLGVLTQWHR